MFNHFLSNMCSPLVFFGFFFVMIHTSQIKIILYNFDINFIEIIMSTNHLLFNSMSIGNLINVFSNQNYNLIASFSWSRISFIQGVVKKRIWNIESKLVNSIFVALLPECSIYNNVYLRIYRGCLVPEKFCFYIYIAV